MAHFPTHQPLGQLMRQRGISASRMAALSGVHPRTLTEYLSGRVEIRHHHVHVLAEVLQVDSGDLYAPVDSETNTIGRDLLHQQPLDA